MNEYLRLGYASHSRKPIVPLAMPPTPSVMPTFEMRIASKSAFCKCMMVICTVMVFAFTLSPSAAAAEKKTSQQLIDELNNLDKQKEFATVLQTIQDKIAELKKAKELAEDKLEKSKGLWRGYDKKIVRKVQEADERITKALR